VTAASEAEAQIFRMIETGFAGVGRCMTNLKLVIREFVGRLTPCESLGYELLVHTKDKSATEPCQGNWLDTLAHRSE